MSESALLDWLRSRASKSQRVPIPLGDDLAGLALDAADGLLLVGVDQVLDGVHFDLRVHSPRLVGRKAMNRNLSDCAAMACLPVAVVATLAIPHGAVPGLARQIVEGIEDAGRAFDCPLVGGDTAAWAGPLAVTVTILGRSAGVGPTRRDGARPGDRLYVTGPLGGSILGRHLAFEPRVMLARELASRFELHAMLDLSDGLSRDLPRLCIASGVGATVRAALVPIHEDARRMNDGQTPLEHALHDGEDHELLFASPHCPDPRVIEIGTIDAEGGVRIETREGVGALEAKGWEHRW